MDQQCQLLNDLFSKLFVGNLVQGFKQALKEVFISFLHLLYHLLTREAEASSREKVNPFRFFHEFIESKESAKMFSLARNKTVGLFCTLSQN